MATPGRPGFLALVWRFLRMPTVWAGGIAAALVLLFAGDVLPGVAMPGAIFVLGATVALEFSLDRRRGPGRRLLFRGASVSPRRTVALVVAMGLVASASATFVSRVAWTSRQGAEGEVRAKSMPNRKRGYY
jgi:hypothetical protein